MDVKLGRMKSTIVEDGDVLTIITPKVKSWILIILFSILLLQSLYGLVRGLFFDIHLIQFERIFIIVVCPTIIFLTLKGILWQTNGNKIISIDSEKLIFKKVSPLRLSMKEYPINNIKSIIIKNETASTGPNSMLQIANIVDPIYISLKYGFDSIRTIGGIDLEEATILQQSITRKIGLI